MEHEKLTHQIIGCAHTVFNKLGFGFLEVIYHKAMVIELTRDGLKVEEEKPLEVRYDQDELLGKFSVDLFVEDIVVVELKSVQQIIIEHEVQLVNYLNALRKVIGLLINFGPNGVEVKRKYKEFKQKPE